MSAIVEIRQYTLFPEKRDVLIDLFERHFVDGLTADGMTVIGSFRTPDDPNRFFWIRGFPSMQARGESLPAFYYGPLWKAHSAAANATMMDSDNALLLHPATPSSGLPIMDDPGKNGAPDSSGLIVATIYHPEMPVTSEFVELFERDIAPAATRAGAKILGSYVTETSENNFPALPVRDIHSFAWFASFHDAAAYEQYQQRVAADSSWAGIRQRFAELKNYSPPEVWRLVPTGRSRLRCR